MTALFVSVGDSTSFSKTITESDIALFAAVSGDFDPIHVDEEYARASVFGRRIAHGALSVALLSTASAMMSRLARDRGSPGVSVSLGYDGVRFLKPVFLGDTLTARYTIAELDVARARTRSKLEVTNQRGELCTVGEHIMKWLPPPGPA